MNDDYLRKMKKALGKHKAKYGYWKNEPSEAIDEPATRWNYYRMDGWVLATVEYIRHKGLRPYFCAMAYKQWVNNERRYTFCHYGPEDTYEETFPTMKGAKEWAKNMAEFLETFAV